MGNRPHKRRGSHAEEGRKGRRIQELGTDGTDGTDGMAPPHAAGKINHDTFYTFWKKKEKRERDTPHTAW